MSDFPRTMLFRAKKLPNGLVVVLHPEHMSDTTQIVAHQSDYRIALGQGWTEDPNSALERFEQQEQEIGNLAAGRAYGDAKMSEPAQREAAAYEESVPTHVPVIPEVTKRKRGRPPKVSSE